MTIWAEGMDLPSGPFFAIAEIANKAIDEAVSNPAFLYKKKLIIGWEHIHTESKKNTDRVHLCCTMSEATGMTPRNLPSMGG